MKLSSYDPDDPPLATPKDMCNRHFGKAAGRTITAFVLMFLLGYNPMEGLMGLLDESLLVQAAGVFLYGRIFIPLLRGVEILVWDTRQSLPFGSSSEE